jgi:hypothetical protein
VKERSGVWLSAFKRQKQPKIVTTEEKLVLSVTLQSTLLEIFVL